MSCNFDDASGTEYLPRLTNRFGAVVFAVASSGVIVPASREMKS